MIQFLSAAAGYIVPFLVVLTVLVFVHELGHFWVARRNGVKVEVFSIGFGPEIFGWHDRQGTRWKISALPLGGYVRMFGDADAASSAPTEELKRMSETERSQSFFYKSLGQRAAIIAAGPAANFVFAIAIMAGLFTTFGRPFTPPTADEVDPQGAAASSGIHAGDRFLRLDGRAVERFEELQRIVQDNPGRPLTADIDRAGSAVTLTVTPSPTVLKDRLGNERTIGRLGIRSLKVERQRHDPFTSIWLGLSDTWKITAGTVSELVQIVAGTRSTEGLGGPLRIAQMSGDVAQAGIVGLLWFMAVLSINLGLINLFPVPVLDGGHLLFYAAEWVRGRPLGPRAQEYATMAGLTLVLALMVFATWNDLVHLRVFDFIGRLFT
jgi:regulator of sigma E protease